MNPAIFLQSQRIYLRPLEQSDAPLLLEWLNDVEIREITGETLPTSAAGLEAYLQRLEGDPRRVWFGIVERETGQLIGETGLLRMFPAWRTTDLSIILGDRSAWGKGYGTEVMLMMLEYAFGALNFHRVAVGVVGRNTRALRFYEKIGFRQEGIQRDGYFANHAYQDFIMMSILEDEFRAFDKKG
jgi:diamine N-acetyltransferase